MALDSEAFEESTSFFFRRYSTFPTRWKIFVMSRIGQLMAATILGRPWWKWAPWTWRISISYVGTIPRRRLFGKKRSRSTSRNWRRYCIFRFYSWTEWPWWTNVWEFFTKSRIRKRFFQAIPIFAPFVSCWKMSFSIDRFFILPNLQRHGPFHDFHKSHVVKVIYIRFFAIAKVINNDICIGIWSLL